MSRFRTRLSMSLNLVPPFLETIAVWDPQQVMQRHMGERRKGNEDEERPRYSRHRARFVAGRGLGRIVRKPKLGTSQPPRAMFRRPGWPCESLSAGKLLWCRSAWRTDSNLKYPFLPSEHP